MKRMLIVFCVGVYCIVVAFSLCACGKVGFEQIETEDMIELHTWFFTSGVPNNAITVKYPNETAVFECSVNKGCFWLLSQYVQDAIIKPNDTIYWQPETSVGGTEQAFVDIVLKLDDYIVGYAVIEIHQNSYLDHTATLLKSAIFPKVNGEYQKLTEEQIKSIIENLK